MFVSVATKSKQDIVLFRRALSCERNGIQNDAKDVELSCPWDGKIKVAYANYGRTRSSSGVFGVCKYKKSHNNRVDCVNSGSLAKVQALCDGKASCTVAPTNAVFGDPCVGTYKYLDVKYLCEGGKCSNYCS